MDCGLRRLYGFDMATKARMELETRLNDVDELILAHGVITGGRRGRPVLRQGAAITRAGVVLLSAATEAFVEDLFEEAAPKIFRGMSEADFTKLFKNTSRRLNNADVFKTEMLYFNLGMPWALKEIKWQKFSNDSLRTELDKLIRARGGIAHGRATPVRLQTLKRWKNMVEMLAPRFERKVAEFIYASTNRYPPW